MVIAGGGTAGWMVAAGLSKTLGKLLDIKLVESDEIGTVGVGEATIPTLVTFHRLLEINEQEFMAATQGTFKLGIGFENWRDVGENYIHSFGITGKDHWTAGFQHFWLKGRERKLAGDYGDYCLELRASLEHRFAHLPRGGMNYAFHIDAGLYAKFLRKFAEGFGVKRIEGKIVDVKVDRDIGQHRLHQARLRRSSSKATCSSTAPDFAGCSSATRCTSATRTGRTTCSATARWRCRPSRWDRPFPTRDPSRATPAGNGASRCSIASATAWCTAAATWPTTRPNKALLANVEGKVLTEPRVIKFRPGQRRQTWRRNCIAIGLASGFIEPLESTSIHLIQRGIIRLMQMFPRDGIRQSDIDEYNQQTNNEIEHIRDFIVLHYHVTRRQDTPFWRSCRAMDIPDSLRHRIDLFRETGRVFRVPNELFAENSWIQVMLGQGIEPQQHHPVADLMGDAGVGALSGWHQDRRSRRRCRNCRRTRRTSNSIARRGARSE